LNGSSSWPAHPGSQSYTGVALPTGVAALAHRSEFNDNLFHHTHYWRLRGPVGSLRRLAASSGLGRSDEDARYSLPDMQQMFGEALSEADVLEGYEGSLDGGRDHWLIVFSEDRGAVFVF
jgi:hypothetical protein